MTNAEFKQWLDSLTPEQQAEDARRNMEQQHVLQVFAIKLTLNTKAVGVGNLSQK